MKTAQKETYTQWCLKYPWHVSDEPYPSDAQENCICECEFCKKHGKHAATRAAHLKV